MFSYILTFNERYHLLNVTFGKEDLSLSLSNSKSTFSTCYSYSFPLQNFHTLIEFNHIIDPVFVSFSSLMPAFFQVSFSQIIDFLLSQTIK